MAKRRKRSTGAAGRGGNAKASSVPPPDPTPTPKPASRTRAWGIAAASIAVLLVAAGAFFYQSSRSSVEGARSAVDPIAVTSPSAEYVGRGACAACHPKESEAWRGSDHDLAMQAADDKTVLGDFADAKFQYAGTTSTFFRRDGKFYVNTDGADGKLHDYEIKYAFGVRPLQQYLIELPGGRMQALGIAWDSRPKAQGGARWFHLYPDQNIKAGDPLHWTGNSQTWNFQCAECHSTNLKKGYDARSDTFHTTWSELDVACEACHGPGLESRRLGEARSRGRALRGDEGARDRVGRAQGRQLDAARRHGKRAAQRAANAGARDRHLRALSRARGAPLRRRSARQADARHAPALAARSGSLLGRRTDARRGLQLGLVRCRARCSRRA